MKTSTGFEFKIVDGVFDDWELFELLADVDSGNGMKIPAVLKKLLGAEQAAALKEHVRGEDGRVTVEAMNAEITDIIRLTGEGTKKKS
jgi:hypothetical protein